MIRSIIIDDERLSRQELRKSLEPFKGVEVVDEACDAEEALEKIDKHNPDPKFSDLSQNRFRDAFRAGPNLFTKDVMGFFDDEAVFEGLPFRLAEAVVVYPEEHGFDDQGFVCVGEAV